MGYRKHKPRDVRHGYLKRVFTHEHTPHKGKFITVKTEKRELDCTSLLAPSHRSATWQEKFGIHKPPSLVSGPHAKFH